MHRYLLGINVRPQNVQDFGAIAKRLTGIAPEIGVLGRPGDLAQLLCQTRLPMLPSLFMFLVNPPLHPAQYGTTISVENFGKLGEYESFKKANINTPKTELLQKAKTYDSHDWGDHLIIKPNSESFGRGVALVETQLLNDFIKHDTQALEGLIAKQYLVQEYVDSGEFQEKYRVIVFLGQVILAYKVTYRKVQSIPKYGSIARAIADNYFQSTVHHKYQLVKDQEIDDFAVKAFNANPQCPLQGLDIQRSKDQRLTVLENNAGGNVWKFSDKKSSPYKIFGPKRMIEQYNAWDTCAQALVETTYKMAS